MIGNVRNGSRAGVEEFRSWLLRSPQMDPSKQLRASNDGKVEWNTKYTRCIPQKMQRLSWPLVGCIFIGIGYITILILSNCTATFKAMYGLQRIGQMIMMITEY